MTHIAGNERSWAINMISEINIFLNANSLMIRKAGGESTVRNSSIRMFPDLLLYSDDRMTMLLQGWELKMPDTPITDTTFINDAERKARALGLDSFILWNFNDCHFYIKNASDNFEIVKAWSNELSHINSREKVNTYQDDWKTVLSEVILDINEYLSTGRIVGNNLDRAISDNIINTIILEYKGLTAEKLRADIITNAVFESQLNLWWNENRLEYLSDEPDMYYAYSKVLILNWINKIIFANLIKRHHLPTREVETITESTSIIEAIEIFNRITSSCDFYNIFSPIMFNDKLSEGTWNIIKEFNQFLIVNNLSNLEQEVLQSIMENTVVSAKREIRGQFTTPQLLGDLLTRITMINRNGNSIDPCCGTGSIVKSLLKEKIRHIGVAEAYNSTWASDKYSFPLQIANISLVNESAINIPSLIFQNNVFDLKKDMKVFIINPENGNRIEYSIPEFDTIVSNLPFVPFEILSNDDKVKIENIRQKVYNETGILLNGKSDLYSYIIFSLWDMLSENGQLGVIISNSWLGTEWGKDFRDALSYYFNIKDLLISTSERWFNNALVITTIMILQKKSLSAPQNASEITFSCVKKSLEELNESRDLQDILVNSVLLNQEINREVIQRNSYLLKDIKDLEIMNISWNALFYDAEWLSEIKDNLIKVSNYFKVFRGARRGWDKMFYPEEGHGIEEEYLKRVLKSSKSITGLLVDTDSDAFCCSETIESLQDKGHIGALNWIRRFENGVNGTGQPLVETLKRKNMHWYEMKDTELADLVTGMNPDKRLFVGRFQQPSFINQRLIGLKKLTPDVDIDICHALMNSIVGVYLIEALGFGRGLGALDINNRNFGKIYMLNPDVLSDVVKNQILQSFQPLLNRTIHSTEIELTLEDRQNFDLTVLSTYGLEEYYPRIKSSLLNMQKARLSVR